MAPFPQNYTDSISFAFIPTSLLVLFLSWFISNIKIIPVIKAPVSLLVAHLSSLYFQKIKIKINFKIINLNINITIKLKNKIGKMSIIATISIPERKLTVPTVNFSNKYTNLNPTGIWILRIV